VARAARLVEAVSVSRLISLEHVLELARAHGIETEQLQTKRPTVALRPCPGCRDGFDALAEWDGFGVILRCNGCQDPSAILDALMAMPADLAADEVATFDTYTPAQLLALPAPVWLVEPFLRDGCVTELFGAFGTYKSFVAAAWSARAPGLAVYGSAEGAPHDLGKTFSAWEQAAGEPARVVCIPHAVNMLDQGDADKLSATLRSLGEPVRLLVIDTLARNMPGGNENSPEDMGRFVGLLDRLRAEFGCACLVLHHSGHDHKERGRGHSSWPSAVDVSVKLEKTATPLEAKLTCTKMRGAAVFDPRVIRLEPMDGTLVVAEVVDVSAALDRRVGLYLDEHPDASQNEVERAVTGGNDEIRASYKRVRQVRHSGGAHPGQQGAPPAAPLKGARGAVVPLDPTLDPDEHARLQDGSW
jgi:hypothetical protein